jgi:hypothetical protein
MAEFKYFKLSEFDCPCEFEDCPKNGMSIDFVKLLDSAREKAGIPFKINSGFRCRSYNDLLQNSSPDSSHIRGLAADVHVEGSRERFLIIESLYFVGFRRFGIYRSHVHVDNDYTKESGVMWYF